MTRQRKMKGCQQSQLEPFHLQVSVRFTTETRKHGGTRTAFGYSPCLCASVVDFRTLSGTVDILSCASFANCRFLARPRLRLQTARNDKAEKNERMPTEPT